MAISKPPTKRVTSATSRGLATPSPAGYSPQRCHAHRATRAKRVTGATRISFTGAFVLASTLIIAALLAF
jgi:hypothetical protein